jgi:hypothetical protein
MASERRTEPRQKMSAARLRQVPPVIAEKYKETVCKSCFGVLDEVFVARQR